MAKEKKKPQKKNTRAWVIHLIANGQPCACCGKIEYPYIPGVCDAHTHGMREKFNHPEFQISLESLPEEIAYVLNTLGDMVKAGRHFEDGELVDGIYQDCQVRLDPIVQDGEKMFRVVIPDQGFRWPEDKECQYPYCLQTKPLAALRNPIPHQRSCE